MRTKSALHCTKLIVQQSCYIHVWKGGSIIYYPIPTGIRLWLELHHSFQ